jgi:hypothetical protein
VHAPIPARCPGAMAALSSVTRPGSPPRPPRRMPSWPRWLRRMSWCKGSLEAAERSLRLAARRFDGPASVPAGRRGQAQLLLGVVRLLLARQYRDLPAVAEEARRLQALAEASDAVSVSLGEDLRAGADQPRQHRGLGRPGRGGGAAPRAGRGAGAPGRTGLSRVHRPGIPGGGGGRRCGSPRATRARRPSCSRRSWTALLL